MSTTTEERDAAVEYEKRQALLTSLFEQVQNKKHWKGEINAIVPEDADVDGIHEAVIHFTGSVPTFTHCRHEGKKMIRVCAAGYWATIGG